MSIFITFNGILFFTYIVENSNNTYTYNKYLYKFIVTNIHTKIFLFCDYLLNYSIISPHLYFLAYDTHFKIFNKYLI